MAGRAAAVASLAGASPVVSCRGQHRPVQLLHLRGRGGALLAPKALPPRSLLLPLLRSPGPGGSAGSPGDRRVIAASWVPYRKPGSVGS